MIVQQHAEGKLPLTSDGELSIYFIGSGSAFTKSMYQNNVLVTKGEQHLLIDFGTKCPQALFEQGVAVADLHNFLITHSHADHIGGLEEVMMVNRYVTRRKPRMIINEAYEDILWHHSLRGGAAYSELRDGQPLGFEDFWEPLRPQPLADMPRETWHYRMGGLDIKMPRTMHFPDNAQSWLDSFWSCGVILDERILFTSDTRFDPELLQSFDERYNFEVIFHDCQFFTGGVHASFDELSTLPEALKRKMLLMHYPDNWEQLKPRVSEEGFLGFVHQGFSYRFD